MKKEDPISIEKLKELLVQTENDKNALLKIVSHDLRSPLNKLIALLGLLKMSGDLSSEQSVYFNKMEIVINDALGRLTNLTDLRAIEGKGIDTHYETFDLGKLLNKIVQEHGVKANRKEITIFSSVESIKFHSDRLSIQRIMDHLLSNAIKFSPKKSEVKIEVEQRENDVHIHVIDGGKGISKEEQQELFKKFSILSTQATGGESSSGLGLFIARWMAKNIMGDITYNNDNESRFTLLLPRTEFV